MEEETRQCLHCEQVKPVSAFYKSIRTRCIDCKRKYSRDYHAAERDNRLAHYREVYARQRKVVNALAEEKKFKPCTDCKGTFPPYVMMLDHPKLGVFKPGNAMRLRGNKAAAKAKLSGYDPVCANCQKTREYHRSKGL